MKPSFLNYDKPLLTVMIKQTQNPDNIKAEMQRAHAAGAEAFGIQLESLPREYHTPEILKQIFADAKDKPVYATNYKLSQNADMSYEEIADELVKYAEYGATLCDLTGDMFCKDEDELTYDEEAIKKQMELVDRLHKEGAEVLMSSHVNKYISASRVLQIAREHKKRGADISKIVVHGNTMEEQIQNLQITNILKEELGIPFLFLSGGDCCLIHRKMGIMLGCCMSLCICDENPKNP